MNNISAIANIYSSMYELNLEKNTYRELRAGYASVDSILPDTGIDLQYIVDTMIHKTVDESCIGSDLLRDIDLSTINERMRFTDTWTREVMNPAKQWRRGRIIVTAGFKQEIERLKNDPELKPWEKVSAAIGIAHFLPGQDKTVEEVFKRSDKAMYEDKIAMKVQRTD